MGKKYLKMPFLATSRYLWGNELWNWFWILSYFLQDSWHSFSIFNSKVHKNYICSLQWSAANTCNAAICIAFGLVMFVKYISMFYWYIQLTLTVLQIWKYLFKAIKVYFWQILSKYTALCSRNFQNVKLRLDFVENYNLTITQILRKIKFGDSWCAKCVILTHLEALNFYV